MTPMNKHERTYAFIKQRIVDGTYGPGHRLVLDTVAGELGVSSVPVREAIRRLEAEGWVVYRPNVGAQVAPIDKGRWVSEMTVLALVEGYASALAAPHLGWRELRTLRAANRDMARAVQALDVLRFSQLNRSFHREICSRCGNPYLLQLWQETNDRLDAIRRTVFPYIPYRARGSLEEHMRLVNLLSKPASFNEIERFARTHKLRTIRAYEQAHAHHADQQETTG
jgi:DNA-binding GntR family transcriptional regulator